MQTEVGDVSKSLKQVKMTSKSTEVGTRLTIWVRSEFAGDSESGVKRVPTQIARGPKHGHRLA